MSVAGALVQAHARSTWNQIVRAASVGGRVATIVSILAVGLVLLLPGFLAFRAGYIFGADLDDPVVMRMWTGITATFTILFGMLGSLRLKPVFSYARFGRFPVSALQLLAAEVPASLIEVFPLLGGCATVLLHAGLLARRPALAPAVILLAVDALATLVATMFLLAALRVYLMRRKWVLASAAAGVAAAAYVSGETPRHFFKVVVPARLAALPLSAGYRGLADLTASRWRSGVTGIAIASVATALLFGVAAVLHRRRLLAEAATDRSSRGPSTFRYTSTPAALGGFFLRQLLSSRAVRSQMYIPFFFAAPLAMLGWIHRSAPDQLPPDLGRMLQRASTLPWLAVLPVMAIGANPPIWLNQFGLDRRGMRTLMLLPIEGRDFLLGKLRGLALFTSIQCAIAAPLLLLIRTPSFRDVFLAVAAGGVTLVLSTAIGHGVSLRFPRPIDGQAGLQVPLYLSWIAPLTLIGSSAAVAGACAIGDLAAPNGGIVAALVLLMIVVAAYTRALPQLAILFDQSRERLVSM